MKKSEKLAEPKISRETFKKLLPVALGAIAGMMIYEKFGIRVLEFLNERKKDGYIDTSKVLKHLLAEESTIKRLIKWGYVEKLPTKKYSKKIMITEKGVEYLIKVKENQAKYNEEK